MLWSMSLQAMSKHDTEFHNYKNIFASLKKSTRNQAPGMHYPCTKQVVIYIENSRKHLDVTVKHIFHNCIDACTKKIDKVTDFKQKHMIFFSLNNSESISEWRSNKKN